jgi:ubiquinone/menaquinone biosynthesis C-methylase UbiE
VKIGVKHAGYALGFIALVYFFDVYLRERWAAHQARKLANQTGKPLLNVGSGTAGSSLTGAKLRGDINCDLAASDNSCGTDRVCHCDVQDLSQFGDKQFGAVLVANVLQYVPNKEMAQQELERVADHVVTVDNWLPWMQLGPGPKFRFTASL